jgi:hypothetical protein
VVPIDLDGRRDGPVVPIPSDVVLLTVGRTGAYVQTSTPAGHTLLEQIGFDGTTDVVAEVDGGYNGGNGVVTWSRGCPRGRCWFFVLDADTGRVMRVADTSVRGSPMMGLDERVSSDGRYVATQLSGLPRIGNEVPRGWIVVDLQTGRMIPVYASIHGASVDSPPDDAVWSRDRLIWVSVSETGTVVGDFNPATERVAATTLRTNDVRVLGALP